MGVHVFMRMSVAMTMAMSVMRISERGEPNEVDDQPQHADNEQLVQTPKFGAVAETVECFEKNFEADEHEKNAVAKTG